MISRPGASFRRSPVKKARRPAKGVTRFSPRQTRHRGPALAHLFARLADLVSFSLQRRPEGVRQGVTMRQGEQIHR